MAIPINEDPYSASFNYNPTQFWISLENLASDVQLTFYRPASIDTICEKTKFSRREIQSIYRSFKQMCPIGVVTKSQFEEIFIDIFPNGSPKRYADLVFRTFDADDDGRICFEEFITGLSVITRGTLSEKFHWIFTLYDVHKRNCIDHADLLYVVQSVHDMLGRGDKISGRRSRFASLSTATLERADITDHVSGVFNRLCRNGETQIERDEFVEFCLADAQICEALTHFKTIF